MVLFVALLFTVLVLIVTYVHNSIKRPSTYPPGIIFSNGEDWKIRRRFTLRNLRDFGFGKSSMDDLILEELKQLAKILNPSNDPAGRLVELDGSLNAAVTNVIWWIAASKRVDNENPEFQDILETISEFILPFDMSKLLTFLPSWRPFVPGFLIRQEDRLKRREKIYSYMQGLIDEHRRTVDPSEPRDLIDCYIIEEKRLKDAGKDSSTFQDDSVAWSLADIFIAGAETTSTTLRWFFLYMVVYPKIQSRIQEEIDNVVGKDRLPNSEDRVRMPYTEAVLWEIWRHKTIVPLGVDRRASKDVEFAGYQIPKGTIMTTMIYAIHHDPDNFEHPEVFNPDRFLTESGQLIKNPKIMPFQAGRRQCLGENLARLNAFLGVVYLLQVFRFEKEPGHEYTLESKPRTEGINVPMPYKCRIIPRNVH
ncbi:unnamed protein product [Notodromas monacha]|uniref:Cytochrome P450 n=1 Tax=Notodromas monacha TaxID=399045 RepID=A0A7R9BUD8_9CRUS|nr:unnamed protein product [Notodromas monacha]CAG0921939.1 unnamed protein product [Notodromas monacha]